MKLLIAVLVLCGLAGCEYKKVETPHTTKVNIDIKPGSGVNVEVKKQ